MTKPNMPKHQLRSREGEGVEVNVPITKTPDKNGNMIRDIHIDFDTLPVPGREYTANVSYAKITTYAAYLYFAQDPLGEGKLSSMCTIQIGLDAFKATLDRCFDGEFWNQLRDFCSGIQPLQPSSPFTDASLPPQQAQSMLTATLVYIGYSGMGACIDFYSLSPFAVRRVAFFDKLQINPVVRVNLPTPLLYGILDAIRPFSDGGSPSRTALLLPAKP